jgi:hypothetical protein
MWSRHTWRFRAFAATSLVLVLQSACHVERQVPTGALTARQSVHVRFGVPQSVWLVPSTGDSTVVSLVELEGRARAVAGDTVWLSPITTYTARSGNSAAPAYRVGDGHNPTGFSARIVRDSATVLTVRHLSVGRTTGLVFGIGGILVVLAIVALAVALAGSGSIYGGFGGS